MPASRPVRRPFRRLARLAGAAALLLGLAVAGAPPASARSSSGGLDAGQLTVLRGIAADTWRFYGPDVDPATHLPLDNLGPGPSRGEYTSAANLGVYLWAVVSAHDLHLISRGEADARITSTLVLNFSI